MDLWDLAIRHDKSDGFPLVAMASNLRAMASNLVVAQRCQRKTYQGTQKENTQQSQSRRRENMPGAIEHGPNPAYAHTRMDGQTDG